MDDWRSGNADGFDPYMRRFDSFIIFQIHYPTRNVLTHKRLRAINVSHELRVSSSTGRALDSKSSGSRFDS